MVRLYFFIQKQTFKMNPIAIQNSFVTRAELSGKCTEFLFAC